MTLLPKALNKRRHLLAGLALLLLPGTAIADGTLAARTLTKTDKERLARYEATQKSAIAEARKGGDKAEVATLDALLAAKPQPILGVDIRGDYRCRTIKLGGGLPLTIYGWFNCRIEEDDLGYRLTKTSGSQRLTGHFIDDSASRLLYYGVSYIAGDKPVRYGAKADDDQVGYFLKTGPSSYRLDLPLPKFESKFDIIELKKK